MLTPLPAMLGQYRREFPNVNLQLHESYTSQVMQSLLNGTLDAGFLRDGDPSEALDIETFFTEPFVVDCPQITVWQTVASSPLALCGTNHSSSSPLRQENSPTKSPCPSAKHTASARASYKSSAVAHNHAFSWRRSRRIHRPGLCTTDRRTRCSLSAHTRRQNS
jgi:DNA-binding transcriptional LysR family regulator